MCFFSFCTFVPSPITFVVSLCLYICVSKELFIFLVGTLCAEAFSFRYFAFVYSLPVSSFSVCLLSLCFDKPFFPLSHIFSLLTISVFNCFCFLSFFFFFFFVLIVLVFFLFFSLSSYSSLFLLHLLSFFSLSSFVSSLWNSFPLYLVLWLLLTDRPTERRLDQIFLSKNVMRETSNK